MQQAARAEAIVVRPLQPADVAACALLFERVQRDTFRRDDPALYAREHFRRDTAGEEVWVAAAGRELAGVISVWRPQPFVHHLLVERAWRRRGIGSALLREALAGMRRPVDLKCRLDNLTAQRFYRRLGWIEVEREQRCATPYIRYRLLPGNDLGDR